MSPVSAALSRKPPSRRPPDWWQSAVIYEVYPRSFADGDGDGVGDLAGLIARLPYIASLGVDGIWMTPFQPSPQVDQGYDVTDYCGVDPLFGTMEQFEYAAGAGARAGPAGPARRRPQPLLLGAPAVPGGPRGRPGLAGAGHVPLCAGSVGMSDDGGAGSRLTLPADASHDVPPNNWQSVFGGRAWSRANPGFGDGHGLVPAPVLGRAAGLELAQSRRRRLLRRRAALLVRQGRGRAAHRRRACAVQGRRAAGLALHGRGGGRAAVQPAGLGPGGRPRGLPPLAHPRREVRAAPPAGGRGQPGAGPRRPLHPRRRDAAGLRLRVREARLGPGGVGRRRERARGRPAAPRRRPHVGAGKPRHRPLRHPLRRRRARQRPGPGGPRGFARTARRRVPLPGPGARAARGRRPGGGPGGSDVGPRRRLPRRRPRPAALDRGRGAEPRLLAR